MCVLETFEVIKDFVIFSFELLCILIMGSFICVYWPFQLIMSFYVVTRDWAEAHFGIEETGCIGMLIAIFVVCIPYLIIIFLFGKLAQVIGIGGWMIVLLFLIGVLIHYLVVKFRRG